MKKPDAKQTGQLFDHSSLIARTTPRKSLSPLWHFNRALFLLLSLFRSLTQAQCLIVCCFCLFFLSLLYVYGCLYLCCLCFSSFTRCLSLSSVFLSISCLILSCALFSSLLFCLVGQRLFVSVFTPEHTKKDTPKQHNNNIHTYMSTRIYIYL